MRALVLVALSLAGMAWTADDAQARPWMGRRGGYVAAPAYYGSYYSQPAYSYYSTPVITSGYSYPYYSSYYYPSYSSNYYYPGYSSYYSSPGYYSPSFSIRSPFLRAAARCPPPTCRAGRTGSRRCDGPARRPRDPRGRASARAWG